MLADDSMAQKIRVVAAPEKRPLVALQLVDHFVEGLRQVPEFVLLSQVNPSVGISGLDFLDHPVDVVCGTRGAMRQDEQIKGYDEGHQYGEDEKDQTELPQVPHQGLGQVLGHIGRAEDQKVVFLNEEVEEQTVQREAEESEKEHERYHAPLETSVDQEIA